MVGILNMNGLFNMPVFYKGIPIYPATLKDDYDLVNKCCDVLTINQQIEKQKVLLKMPFLQYLLQIDNNDNNNNNIDIKSLLQYILSISFKNCDIGFSKNGFDICYRTELYDKYYNQFIKSFIELNMATTEETKIKKQQEIQALKKKIYVIKSLTNEDFVKVKNIICVLNGVQPTSLAPGVETDLLQQQKAISERQKTFDKVGVENKKISTDELIMGVAFYLHKTPIEIQNMSLLTFKYYLQLMFTMEIYKQGVAAQVKTEFWLQPYKQQSKYEGMLTQMDLNSITKTK